MRKLFFLLAGILFSSLILFSCSDENKEVFNNTQKIVDISNEEVEAKPIPDFDVNDFRIVIYFKALKVPKRISPTGGGSGINCSFGFGFCAGILITWYQVPYPHQPEVLKNEDVALVYKIDKDYKRVIFYAPSSLTSLNEFSQSDVAEFTIYEDMIVEKGVVLKPGDYPKQYDSKGNYAYAVDIY
ncbi:hypothetical protein ACKUSY_16245 [Myroides odoratus]